LKTLLQSLSFEILFFSSQKQTNLDQFLTFFEKISRIYQENSQAKPKNKTLVSIDTRQVAKHDQAEYQPATQTHFSVHLISRKFQSFSGKL
jgi:stress-induced morphogen